MNATTPRQGIPLRPDYFAARDAAAQSFIRAVTASLISANRSGMRGETPAEIARRCWSHDRDVPTIIRAASSPATIGNSAWAGVLAQVGHVMDVISLLAPASVAAALLKRCLNFEWPEGVVQMSVPTINVSPNITSWVGEGTPIPVWDFISSSTPLTPCKVATACIFSREMTEQSVPNIEELVRVALSESLGLALDVTLLGSAAATAISPPGILSGIAPLTASVNTIPSEAMTEDIARCIAAVAVVAGNNDILLVMSPRQAASMKVRTDIGQFSTFSSAALADGTLVAIASNALASVGDAAPEFSSSVEAAVHMQTVPQPVPAPPERSLFQTECVALRLKFSMNWVLRSPSGAAFVQNVVW